MSEKTVVVALGHKALGATLPEQKQATKAAAKAIAELERMVHTLSSPTATDLRSA